MTTLTITLSTPGSEDYSGVGMPVTMRDVAHKAGVSIKTVSRVVNEEGEVSEATRQRVLATIGELG